MADTVTVQRLEKLQQAADLVLDRVSRFLEESDPGALTPQAIKHFSSTLKDIRDIHAQRPESESGASGILVRLEKELEEYSG